MLIAKIQKTRQRHTACVRHESFLKTLLSCAVFVCALPFAGEASAGSSRATMQVRATVLPECTFMTPNVNFETFTGKRVQITIQNDHACQNISDLDRPVITAQAGPPNVEPGCELKSLPTDQAATIYEACYELDAGTDIEPGTVLWTVTF